MSDLLPTRSKALIRGSKPHGLSSNDWVAGPVLRMYGNGDLLTREEAAADPEVRMLILDIYTRDAKAARVMDVEADGRDLLCPFCGGSGPRNDDRWHRSDCDRR